MTRGIPGLLPLLPCQTVVEDGGEDRGEIRMHARQEHPTVLQGSCLDVLSAQPFHPGFGGGLWGFSVGSRHGDVLVSVATANWWGAPHAFLPPSSKVEG